MVIVTPRMTQRVPADQSCRESLNYPRSFDRSTASRDARGLRMASVFRPVRVDEQYPKQDKQARASRSDAITRKALPANRLNGIDNTNSCP